MGVTAVYIRKLARDGWFKPVARGQFDARDVIGGIYRFLKDESRRSTKSEAASRVTSARTQEIELRILDRSGELVTHARTEGLAVVDMALGGLRADLAAAPARITSDLELRRKIETVLNDALRAAATRAGNAARGIEEGDEPSDAGGAIDAGHLGAVQ